MSSLLYPSINKTHSVPAKKVKVHGSGAIACLSNTLQVLKQPKPISFQKNVKSMAWHPTQLSLYAGNENGEVYLWNPTHFKEPAKMFKPHLSTVLGLDVSMNYDVASCSSDKTIKIYNSELRYVTTLNAHTNWVREVQWRDPFTLISASDDHTIKIWDVRSKNSKSLTFKGHVTDMQIHPIDNVVGITHSSCVSLFDFRQMDCIQLYPLNFQPRGFSFSHSHMAVVGPYAFEVFNVQTGDIKFHVNVEEQIFDVEWSNKAFLAMSKTVQEWTIPTDDYLESDFVNTSGPIDIPVEPHTITVQKDLKAEIRKHSMSKSNKPKVKEIKKSLPKLAKPVQPVLVQQVQQVPEKSADVILLERTVDGLTTQVEMLTRTVDVLLDRLQQVEGALMDNDE